MNINHNAVIFALFIMICSCNKPLKRKHDDSVSRLSFFDSIATKKELSINQVKKHLNVDSGFFTLRSHFAGDTIYYRDSKLKLVILTCDDQKICLEKYLLIYRVNQVKTSSFIKIETDCDIDYGADYNKLDFKIFNDKQFYTRDVWYQVDSSAKVKITKTDQFYQIASNGKIDSIKNKPPGVIVPDFVPMDVTDND